MECNGLQQNLSFAIQMSPTQQLNAKFLPRPVNFLTEIYNDP